MSKIVRILVIVGFLFILNWGSVSAITIRDDARQNKKVVINVSSATKVLDLGGSGTGNIHLSATGWQSTRFDDSGWSTATQVPLPVQRCVMAEGAGSGVAQWGDAPGYWGDNEAHDYLVRQTFTIPSAKDYTGSTLIAGIANYSNYGNNPPAQIYLNGRLIDQESHEHFESYVIKRFLVPGKNVLAMYAPSPQDQSTSNLPCAAFTFTVNVRAIGITSGPSLTPRSDTVVVVVPAQNAIVAGTTIPFTWRHFGHATSYYLQIWLTRPADGQTVNAHSMTTLSVRVTGTHYDLNASLMPKGTYQWRLMAVDGQGKTISQWTSEHTITLQ